MPHDDATISAHEDGSIRIWNTASGKTETVRHQGVDPATDDFVFRSLWIDDKGRLAVSGDNSGTIGIWNIPIADFPALRVSSRAKAGNPAIASA
jgi:WD40 repeat protein